MTFAYYADCNLSGFVHLILMYYYMHVRIYVHTTVSFSVVKWYPLPDTLYLYATHYRYIRKNLLCSLTISLLCSGYYVYSSRSGGEGGFHGTPLFVRMHLAIIATTASGHQHCVFKRACVRSSYVQYGLVLAINHYPQAFLLFS